MNDRKTNMEAIRGMALSAGAAIAKDEAVSSQVEDDFDHERLKVKVRIGKRMATFTVDNIEVDHLLSDAAVRTRVERVIEDALKSLQPTK